MIKKSEKQEKIRIKMLAYDHRLVDSCVKQIIEVAERNGAKIVGPIPLPTEKRVYTVNRSTFVHKNSREQFEMRVHKRLLEILNPEQKIIESLSDLNIPSGIDIEIKIA